MIRLTSDPLAIRMRSGVPAALCHKTYAPFSRFTAGGYLERSITGTFWRVSNRNVGPVLCLSAAIQAAAVSVASAGRRIETFGMQRKLVCCSMGSCVGPSSPT